MKFLSTTLVFFSALTIGNSLAAQTPSLRQQQAVDEPSPGRVLQAAKAGPKITPGNVQDGTIATFTIAQAITPLLAGMSNKKECHQLACWVAVPTENCGMTAANQVQRELTRGRNSFSVESVNDKGMWVRYWRTKFTPPDKGDVAEGTCGGGSKFVVTNCMQAAKVHC